MLQQMSNKRFQRNIINIGILLGILILAGTSVFAMVNGREPDHGENPIGELDVMRSQILVKGAGYELNYDQQKKRQEEEKKKEEKKKEEEKKGRASGEVRTRAWANAAPGSGNDSNNSGSSNNTNSKGSGNTGKKGTNDSKKGNEGGKKNNNKPSNNVRPSPDNPGNQDVPEGPNNQIDESMLPVIETDLEDGGTYGGNYLGFYVSAKDYKNRSISRQFFDVHANGVKLYSSGTDDEKANYDFELYDGVNTITISVTDREGNVATRTYEVNGDTSQQGEEVGAVEISLSARNINLGYLAGPQTMVIHRNEKLSYVITRFLEENGFGYEYTGSKSYGFYLQRIKKTGMLRGWSIPDDIQQHLDDKGVTSMGWDENSLGEKDIYEGSGWMYALNGEIVDSGFSSIIVLDGDVVEIWFTTHLGEDGI